MPSDTDDHDHEPELWPYRKDLLISTGPLDDLIGGVLDDRIFEIGSRGDLGDRVDTDFTEEDFDVFTGRDTGERTRWLYDIGDPARDPIDDAVIANNNSVETSPILAITLSGHYNVMPGTKPIDSTKTISLDESIEVDTDANIAVVDSGYTESPATPSWLADRVRPVDKNIDEDKSTGLWNGHGKFVASIIVQQNPRAFVWVAALKPLKPVDQEKFLHWVEVDSGDPLDHFFADEFALFTAVRRLLDSPGVPQTYRALNLSAGAWTGGLSLSGLLIRSAVELWRVRQPGVPILAAAGNHLDPPPPRDIFVPGAWTHVTDLHGVKSLTQDEQQRSFFSNDAPIGAVGEGLLGIREDGKTAHWSGTSFATAVVSAHVAKTDPPKAPPSVVQLDPIWNGKLGTPPSPPPPDPVG